MRLWISQNIDKNLQYLHDLAFHYGRILTKIYKIVNETVEILSSIYLLYFVLTASTAFLICQRINSFILHKDTTVLIVNSDHVAC